MDIFWTTLVAATSGTACALLGCFLLLKRMSMLGDALSHGILPGIVFAVIVTGQITSVYLFAGAMLFGLLTAVLIQALGQVSSLPEDACQGIVATGLFALGVLLINRLFRNRHLDLDCVFFGLLEVVPTHTQTWWGIEVPEVMPTLALALGVVLLALTLFWKELKLASFDSGLASALGYPAWMMHYGLIALVAGVSVVSFEAFGSVLVLAMLVVPPGIAHLLTDRFDRLLWVASLTAVLASVVGNVLAVYFNVSIAGMIGTVLGAMFTATVFFAPHYGVLSRWLRQRRLSQRMAGEDILGLLYRAEESKSVPNLYRSEHGFSRHTIAAAIQRLRKKGLIETDAGESYRLTSAGRTEAENVVRAHRLWEAYLDRHFILPLDHLHVPAAEMEHFLGPEMQHQLAQELARPGLDPHGKNIPPETMKPSLSGD